MRSAKQILQSLKEDPRRRRSPFADPSVGLEYNGLCWNPKLSQYRYYFDIASTPLVFKDLDEPTNVHAKAYKANMERTIVDYRSVKFHGRRK